MGDGWGSEEGGLPAAARVCVRCQDVVDESDHPPEVWVQVTIVGGVVLVLGDGCCRRVNVKLPGVQDDERKGAEAFGGDVM